MSKIAVNAYLNTNIKAVEVSGNQYFPVYYLVRCKGKSTRVKSRFHKSYFSVAEFDLLPKSSLDEERNTLENLVSCQVLMNAADDSFDTHLFGILLEDLSQLTVVSRRESNLGSPALKALQSNGLLLPFRNKHRDELLIRHSGPSYLDWFTPGYQSKLLKLLRRQKINPHLALPLINLGVLYKSFDAIEILSSVNPKKYQPILSKYKTALEQSDKLAFETIQKALSHRI